MEATYAVVRERKAVAKEATQHRIGLFLLFRVLAQNPFGERERDKPAHGLHGSGIIPYMHIHCIQEKNNSIFWKF